MSPDDIDSPTMHLFPEARGGGAGLWMNRDDRSVR